MESRLPLVGTQFPSLDLENALQDLAAVPMHIQAAATMLRHLKTHSMIDAFHAHFAHAQALGFAGEALPPADLDWLEHWCPAPLRQLHRALQEAAHADGRTARDLLEMRGDAA